VRQDSDKLDTLLESTQQLQRATEGRITISDDVHEQLVQLVNNRARALQPIDQEKVLSIFAFDGMNQREEAVETADPQTFRWFLQPDTEPVQSRSNQNSGGLADESNIMDEKARIRRLFVDWLTSGSGIFHFHGKLGSGKSTLLKFLSNNDVTRVMLQKWAGKLRRIPKLRKRTKPANRLT